MKTIQEQLEYVRKEKGFTQMYIANKLGITQSAYSNYFTRNVEMRYSLVSQICDAMGMSVVDVITYPEKYVPLSEIKNECSECKKKDLIIENLNNYIELLKKQKK